MALCEIISCAISRLHSQIWVISMTLIDLLFNSITYKLNANKSSEKSSIERRKVLCACFTSVALIFCVLFSWFVLFFFLSQWYRELIDLWTNQHWTFQSEVHTFDSFPGACLNAKFVKIFVFFSCIFVRSIYHSYLI